MLSGFVRCSQVFRKDASGALFRCIRVAPGTPGSINSASCSPSLRTARRQPVNRTRVTLKEVAAREHAKHNTSCLPDISQYLASYNVVSKAAEVAAAAEAAAVRGVGTPSVLQSTPRRNAGRHGVARRCTASGKHQANINRRQGSPQCPDPGPSVSSNDGPTCSFPRPIRLLCAERQATRLCLWRWRRALSGAAAPVFTDGLVIPGSKHSVPDWALPVAGGIPLSTVHVGHPQDVETGGQSAILLSAARSVVGLATPESVIWAVKRRRECEERRGMHVCKMLA